MNIGMLSWMFGGAVAIAVVDVASRTITARHPQMGDRFSFSPFGASCGLTIATILMALHHALQGESPGQVTPLLAFCGGMWLTSIYISVDQK